FIATAAEAIEQSSAQTMLTPGIHGSYQEGIGALAGHPQVKEVARGQAGEGPYQCQAGLYVVSAVDFLADEVLQAEVFGAAALLIECADLAEMRRVAEALEGQLTATLQ